MMAVLGYLGAVLVGITLGLFGAGGSILTLPIIHYIFGVDPSIATSYTLFIVGVTAWLGALHHARKKNVQVRTGLLFALPGLVAVHIMRTFIYPAIPMDLFSVAGNVITKEVAILIVFAIIMFAAAIAMIRRKQDVGDDKKASHNNVFLFLLSGAAIGMVTGAVGAGGGFLIVPALIFFAGLPMSAAIGTSLFIIAINASYGFVRDVQMDVPLDWRLLIQFTIATGIGMAIGTFISKRIKVQHLRKGFGWFVLLMAVFIIIEELYLEI